MCFHDIGPHRILQGQPLEVIGIVHPHVVGLILHHRKGPALHFEEVVGDLIEARRTEDIHLLSIQLPWLLQPQAGHPKAWVLSCFIIMVPLKAATLGYIRGWRGIFGQIPPGCSPSWCVPSWSHPQRHRPRHSRVPRTHCTFLERC